MKLKYITVFVLIICCTVLTSYALEKNSIPEPLKPWVDWVLHDQEEQVHCIPQYNDSSQLTCSWPTELNLHVNSHGGTFEQAWQINYESWITLPGNNDHWPKHVTVNEKAAVVVKKNNHPQIKLQKGHYKITGKFTWNKLPEHIQIPGSSALISVSVNNRKIDFPNIDEHGRLWLQSRTQTEDKIENRLNVKTFRLIDDKIPPRVVVQLDLDAAGSAREILLGPAFEPDKFIPVSLQSSLPARVEQDGRIRVQIRPGHWIITLTVRHKGPVTALTFNRPADNFWPSEEIWVFNANTNLRTVEIDGLQSIDPKQTSLPDHWRNYPAYRVLDGDTMKFKEIKRGDPVPAPDQLSLQRNLWLRFDGSGYTIQDLIEGRKSSNWRLEMVPSVKLGRVSVDGVEQFITKRKESDNAGIELRRGMIKLSADSEYHGSISKIPATGWEHDFQKVTTRLFLPPGYRLLHASGTDNVPDTWLNRWSLLDLFIVLIFTISIAKLYSPRLAIIAFITLGLLFHESGAPQWVWLAIILGIALLRHLPEGRLKKTVKLYQLFIIIIFISISIPFAIKELRVGIYPQLEKPWHAMAASYPGRQFTPSAPEELKEQTYEMLDSISSNMPAKSLRRTRKSKDQYWSRSNQVLQYDPSMINQTGPGLPAWNWNSVHLSSGPVQKGQHVFLAYTGPGTNLVLSFVRVIMMIVLVLGIAGVNYRPGGGWQLPDFKSFLTLAVVLCYLFIPIYSDAGEIPSPEMFKQLQQRLLEKDDCFPNCADISSMGINITPTTLEVKISIDSQLEAAVPLPGSPRHWLPNNITINGKKSKALYKTKTGLWILTPAGKHEINIKGPLPGRNTIELPMPLKPHFVEINQKGWTSEGVHQDGTIDNQIQFKRITEKRAVAGEILETGILPQFSLVERTLLLGLDWKVITRVQRLSPAGSAIVLTIPLIKGESIIQEGIKVKDGNALINLDAKTSQIQWESVLEKTDEITLRHKDTDQWTETWQVDVSPVYHMEHEGIPVILHEQGNRWLPMWHPWPQEELKLMLSRPVGVEGQTITIDRSHLEIRPGQRITDSTLTLSIRSSQGGQHTIVIPENSQLQEIKINGKTQPIRQEVRNVSFPIIPGKQDVLFKWRTNSGISVFFKTPEVDLGISSANVNLDAGLPYNRWPLILSGPQMGPAILFWSVVIVIFLIAIILNKTGYTPLKFHHWFLLGIGMSQSEIVLALLVVAWLIVLHFREKAGPDMKKSYFNLMQISIVLLTFSAFGALVIAISQGLLGSPDMSIMGNGSNRSLLKWYQDYSAQVLPEAGIISIPIFYYRLAMLAWALWISFSLIKILKWGWSNFTRPVIWHSIQRKKKPGRQESIDDKDARK